MRTSLRSVLELVAGSWKVGLLDGRWLPKVAADLLAAGVDAPSMVELAGLDLDPFDPRDAGELLAGAYAELEVPMPDVGEALVTATVFVAWAVRTGGLPPQYATQWALRACIHLRYPVEPAELIKLFVLSDEYDLVRYGQARRSIDEIDDDVHAVAQGLLANSDATMWAIEPCASHLVDLIVPAL